MSRRKKNKWKKILLSVMCVGILLVHEYINADNFGGFDIEIGEGGQYEYPPEWDNQVEGYGEREEGNSVGGFEEKVLENWGQQEYQQGDTFPQEEVYQQSDIYVPQPVYPQTEIEVQEYGYWQEEMLVPTPIIETPVPTPISETPVSTPISETPIPTPISETPVPTSIHETPVPTPRQMTPVKTNSQTASTARSTQKKNTTMSYEQEIFYYSTIVPEKSEKKLRLELCSKNTVYLLSVRIDKKEKIWHWDEEYRVVDINEKEKGKKIELLIICEKKDNIQVFIDVIPN